MTAGPAARRFRRVALTGGIATGKSYCLARFAALGVPTIDADQLSRDALAPGSPALTQVAARFGAGVFTADGSIDRPALARIVFTEPAARRDLEAIVHPLVYAAIASWFADLERMRDRRVAMADIPLLFETGHAADFDTVIVAWCPPALQFERLTARDRLADDDARQRIAAQMPIDEKARMADVVIDTSRSFEETDRQVQQVKDRFLSTL